MSDLTQPRTSKPGTKSSIPLFLAIGEKAKQGGMACLDPVAGVARSGQAGNANLLRVGTWAEDRDNSNGSRTWPVLCDLDHEITGQWLDNSYDPGSEITPANLYGQAYMLDDHFVGTTSSGNSPAGRIWALTADGRSVFVETPIPGASAAPPTPAITSAVPNIGIASGGWTVTIFGSNFVDGVTSVRFFGTTPATDVVVVTDSCLTCTAPAFSTLDGTATPQAVAVSNDGGATHVTLAGAYYVLPGNVAAMACYHADAGITELTGVAGWDDQTPNARNLSQATNAWQPALVSDWNGSGHAAVSFDGVDDMLASLFLTPIAGAQRSLFMAFQLASIPASGCVGNLAPGVTPLNAYQALFQVNAGNNCFISDGLASAFGMGAAPDTSPHVCGYSEDGSGAATGYLDDLIVSGSINAGINSGLVTVGAELADGDQVGSPGANPTNAVIPFVLAYEDAVSGADAATILAILRAAFGIS